MVNTALGICHAARQAHVRFAPIPLRPRTGTRRQRAGNRSPEAGRRREAVCGDIHRRLPVRLDPDRIGVQSHARWSFHPSQAATRHIAATSSNWPTGPTPRLLSANAMSEPITMAPELTILLAATVRAVSALGTVVVRNA